jgi:hypothetical protein
MSAGTDTGIRRRIPGNHGQNQIRSVKFTVISKVFSKEDNPKISASY